MNLEGFGELHEEPSLVLYAGYSTQRVQNCRPLRDKACAWKVRAPVPAFP